jgi:hypothetical protein
MKRFEGGYYAVVVAVLCGGCGAAPADEVTAGDPLAENAQALAAPRKGAPPRRSGGQFVAQQTAFSYAGGGLALPVTNVGSIRGRVTVGDPMVRKSSDSSSGVHSLAEISAQDTAQQKTVEIGWIVYDDDPNPRLFVFYWTNGSPRCNLTTQPHYRCNSFVSTSSSIQQDMVVPVGATLDLGITHVDSGSTAGWHFLYNGTDFGYLPDSLWSNSFRDIQIGMWFGEVVGSTNVRCSEMGNGNWGSAGATGATTFPTLQYTVRGQAPTNGRMQLIQTEPARYTAAFTGTQFEAPISFGGPYSSSALCPQPPPPPTCSNPKPRIECCEGTVPLCPDETCPLVCE